MSIEAEEVVKWVPDSDSATGLRVDVEWRDNSREASLELSISVDPESGSLSLYAYVCDSFEVEHVLSKAALDALRLRDDDR